MFPTLALSPVTAPLLYCFCAGAVLIFIAHVLVVYLLLAFKDGLLGHHIYAFCVAVLEDKFGPQEQGEDDATVL